MKPKAQCMQNWLEQAEIGRTCAPWYGAHQGRTSDRAFQMLVDSGSLDVQLLVDCARGDSNFFFVRMDSFCCTPGPAYVGELAAKLTSWRVGRVLAVIILPFAFAEYFPEVVQWCIEGKDVCVCYSRIVL